MLVGGGNALDAPGVKPRLSCKLGQIPAYTVSPEATDAGLQVGPTASTPQHYQAGRCGCWPTRTPPPSRVSASPVAAWLR